MDRGTKRIAKHRKRHDVAATGPRRRRLWEEQGGRCAMCQRPVPLEGDVLSRMHEAHAVNVGMGRSRHDQGHAINRRENRAGLDAKCHREFEAMPRERRIELCLGWWKRYAGKVAVTTCVNCRDGLHEACAKSWLLAESIEPDSPTAAVACGCGHGGGA